MTDTCRPKLRSYDLNLKLCEAPPEGWRRVLKAASGLLVRPSDHNRVVVYVRGLEGAQVRRRTPVDWGHTIQVHAIEIDGQAMPGVILGAKLSEMNAADPQVLTVDFAVGQFRTEDVRRQVVSYGPQGVIRRVHHGWRARAVQVVRWGRSTLEGRFPILAR